MSISNAFNFNQPAISMHSLRSMNSTSLRNLNEMSQHNVDDKYLMQMSSISAGSADRTKLDPNKPQQQSRFTTPDIIVTDENSVVHNELTYNKSACDVKLLSSGDRERSDSSPGLTQVYFRRWVILAIFASISLLSAFNWIEYNIIQDVTIQFYNQSLPEGNLINHFFRKITNIGLKLRYNHKE